ncbi:MAG: ABC transporter substrate-binding protein, partial [Acidimicrobiia bacterium]
SESDLLVDDEVDALFHAAEPEAFVAGNPLVARLFTDSRGAERAYYAKTGVFPIMHAVAIRSDIAEANPWLPEAVFRAYTAAKQQALHRLRTMGWAMISLPWLAQEEEATRDLMGDNFWSYGLEANRGTLDSLLEYSHEQGLMDRIPSPEELFHPSTLDLTEAL